MNKKPSLRVLAVVIAGFALSGAGYMAGRQHAALGVGASADSMAASGDSTGSRDAIGHDEGNRDAGNNGSHNHDASSDDSASENAGKLDPKTGRKVLYWHDPMVPNQHFDKPGKSPFMDMQLQPVFADEQGKGDGVRIDASLQQNLGIRYATVRRRDAAASFDAVGTTQFDESRSEVVQSRVTGYIDHLYANAPLQRVAAGAPIASLFVPDWLAPQEEYLALRRGRMDLEEGMLEAARTRMRALSIPEELIAGLDRTGKVQTHVTLFARQAGVVTELDVRNGAMVSPGQTLARISGLSTLWLVVEIPESLALQVRPGMKVEASFAGDASHPISGQLREILPGIDTSSRTLRARLEIDNANLALTPGMLVRARVSGAKPVSGLFVPSEAVITTGKRSIVIVRQDDGRLQPVEITPGNDSGDDTEVKRGLDEGQQVVASGQFLIDSEASLKSVLPRLEQSDASISMPAEPASGGASSGTSSETTSGATNRAMRGPMHGSMHEPKNEPMTGVMQ